MQLSRFEKPEALNELLGNLVSRSEAITALLISRGGVCISQAGITASFNTTALAALVAGMFAATREVAKIIGEKQFSILLQQGEKRHIHISLIGDRNMMVVVFEDIKRIGRVRHEARSISSDLVEILQQRNKALSEDSNISVPEFREYAMNQIDKIFVADKGENATSEPG